MRVAVLQHPNEVEPDLTPNPVTREAEEEDRFVRDVCLLACLLGLIRGRSTSGLTLSLVKPRKISFKRAYSFVKVDTYEVSPYRGAVYSNRDVRGGEETTIPDPEGSRVYVKSVDIHVNASHVSRFWPLQE